MPPSISIVVIDSDVESLGSTVKYVELGVQLMVEGTVGRHIGL